MSAQNYRSHTSTHLYPFISCSILVCYHIGCFLNYDVSNKLVWNLEVPLLAILQGFSNLPPHPEEIILSEEINAPPFLTSVNILNKGTNRFAAPLCSLLINNPKL